MDIDIEELIDLLDAKLLFITSEGEYEGILKLVMVKNQRATFDHSYLLPSRKYMGTMQIPLCNFQSYRLLESPNAFENASEDKSSCNQINPDEGKRSKSDEYESVNDNSKRHTYCDDYCFVESIGPTFFRVIDHILECNTIGVSFHGHELSRHGNLSWVCIGTSQCVFMFDIDNIGIAAFRKGLKRIFQDKSIEKVIHDCREPADTLKHLFQTELRNVFDTQVADYLINMQEYTGKGIFKNVNSLDSCLIKYLKVPHQLLYNRKKCISNQATIKFYKMRPIGEDFRKVLVKSVLYLNALKAEQEQLLLEPFHKTVDMYLNILRDASEAQIFKMPTQFTQSAPQYLLDCIKVVRFQDMTVPEDEAFSQFIPTSHGRKHKLYRE